MQLYKSSIDNIWSFFLLNKEKLNGNTKHTIYLLKCNKSLPFCGWWCSSVGFFLGLSLGCSQPASSLGLQDPRWPHSYAWALLLTVNWGSLSLTCSKVFHHSWARWTSYSCAGSIPRAQKWNLYFFLEPSETYTISFYKSKRVLIPAWIQGLGEETLPVDWKNFNKCVIIFYFPHWASKNLYQNYMSKPQVQLLEGSDYFLYLFSHFKLRV